MSSDPAPVPAAPNVKVGFVGLGAIGLPMAERLLDCGVDLAVWNRTIDKAEPLRARGARVSASPAELCDAVEVVVSCLHGPPSDRAVFLGADGLLSVDIEGKLFINTSTNGPDCARELARETERRGGQYLDSPILGAGPPSAAAGRLLFPASGSAEVVARAIAVLRCLATSIEHVGAVGMGQIVKLANNMQVAVGAASLAQSIRFAVGAGADPEGIGRILPLSSSHSRVMDMWLQPMLQHTHGAGGSLTTLKKDVDLAIASAAAVGESATVAVAASRLFADAVTQGWGDRAVQALIEARPE
ncbi:MAG: NAD(P)-dependent oxidoreductase [Acidimicrobiales bacterium]|nr:NAD(P)-dependent oxidoreductase [Acidimicrobiales bacterium]